VLARPARHGVGQEKGGQAPAAQAAIARTGSQSPVERLATEERRTAVRLRLGRVGRLGRDSIPALATELRALAVEPLPERALDDDVWGAVCTALLAEVARPDLN